MGNYIEVMKRSSKSFREHIENDEASSGGGIFVIHGTTGEASIPMTDMTEMNIDKTFDEILEALNGGQLVVLDFDKDGYHLFSPLTSYRLVEQNYDQYFYFNNPRFKKSGYDLFEGYISNDGTIGYIWLSN